MWVKNRVPQWRNSPRRSCQVSSPAEKRREASAGGEPWSDWNHGNHGMKMFRYTVDYAIDILHTYIYICIYILYAYTIFVQ